MGARHKAGVRRGSAGTGIRRLEVLVMLSAGHGVPGARYQLPLGMLPAMRKDPLMDMDMQGPGVAELVAGVAAAVARQPVAEDVFDVIVREMPQLEEDKPLLALLASSVDGNVEMCLQIMQHRIGLSAVRAPAAAVEYARRLAQRDTPLTTLLRTYRVAWPADRGGCSTSTSAPYASKRAILLLSLLLRESMPLMRACATWPTVMFLK